MKNFKYCMMAFLINSLLNPLYGGEGHQLLDSPDTKENPQSLTYDQALYLLPSIISSSFENCLKELHDMKDHEEELKKMLGDYLLFSIVQGHLSVNQIGEVLRDLHPSQKEDLCNILLEQLDNHTLSGKEMIKIFQYSYGNESVLDALKSVKNPSTFILQCIKGIDKYTGGDRH